MKVILPNALNCGCGYELFWTLNPKKLESFFEAYRLKIKEQITMQDSFAWLQGTYVREALMDAVRGKNNYPRQPRGLNNDDEFYYDNDNQNQATENIKPHGKISDGQKFALFMVKHNKALSAKRAKK